MKNIQFNDEIKITYYSEEKQRDVLNYIAQQQEKEKKKILHKCRGKSFLKCMFFSPLSICTRVLATVCKIIGSISAIGMPYGIYNIYKTIVQVNEGIAFGDIECTKWIAVFVILPFVAFALHYLFDKSSNYFFVHRK